MIKIYRISALFLAIISIILILFSNKTIPSNLFLVPTMFAILIVIFPSFTSYIFKNIGITIINISMLIRYLISPMLMAIYGLDLNRGRPTMEHTQFLAVNLMVYEMIIMFIIFALFHKKFYKENLAKRERKITSNSNIFGWVFIALSLIILYLNPTILTRYSFVWLASELKSKDVEGVSVSFFLTIIQLSHLILTVSILNIIYRFYEKKPHFIFVILSIFVVAISSSFIVGTSRFSIILPLVTGLYTILKLYKPYRKLLGFLSIALSFIFIAVSTSLKRKTITGDVGSSTFENLNTDLQLYFSGVANVAHSVNTRLIYEPFNVMAILSDLFRSVIYLNSLFGQHVSALMQYNVSFYGGGPSRDQILPMIGQGYLYFGFILAPILTALTIIIVMYLDKKIMKSSSLFTIYIITYLCLKFALFNMANATIQISFFTNFFLILLIIEWLNKTIKTR